MFQALKDAIKRIAASTPVGSALRTRDWEELVPTELRNQALYSSGVESIRVLDTVKAKLEASVGQMRERVANGEALVSRDSFVADLKTQLAEEGLGTGEGGLTDISSARRLRLIYDTQVDRAHGYARHVAGQDPDILDAWPAQELVRIEQRDAPRDWKARWTAAGGRLVNGRMVALKSDPIWAKLSRFGTPFPPYDFGSGMGVEDVSLEEAQAFGLIKRGESPQPAPNTGMGEISEADLGADKLAQLGVIFGNQVQVRDGNVRFSRNPGGAS